jgi:hypothetical protein
VKTGKYLEGSGLDVIELLYCCLPENNINIIIQFYIYLRAELNSQWPVIRSQHEYNNSKATQDNREREREEMDQLKFFTLIHELLQISIYLQTAIATETHLSEGQWLKVIKLCVFRVGTRMLTVSRTERQQLVPINIFIKKKA